MAINRQDYQYVYNTLPSEKILQDDGTLKVGAVVENLLPRLGDDTAYVPYMEYYANKDPNKSWCSNATKSDPITKTTTETEKNIAHIGSSTITKQGTGSWSGWTKAEAEAALQNASAEYKIFTYTNNNPNWINGKLSFKDSYGRTIYPSSSKDNTYTFTLYTGDPYVSTYTANSGSTAYCIKMNENYASAVYTWTEELASITSKNTKENGELEAVATLVKNTQYVIQVVNAYKITDDNKIITPNGGEISFDSYLCFNALEDGEYTFKINGLSFGCKVYGIEIKGTGSNMVEQFVELRNYQAPSTAQVYLFESDKPWEVDINGKITNMKDAASGSVNPTSASGLALTAEEIENMFFEAPTIATTENQLTVSIPNWSTVGGLYTTAVKPDTHKDLYLLTYRDCLIAENRRYNGTKLKVRRGLLRCIHKTMDINNTKLQEKIVFNGLTHPSITNGTRVVSISDSMDDASNPKLWPYLGRNYSYGNQNWKYSYENQNWKKDMDKYTSVCFALGVKDESGDYKRISEFSRPIIVERYDDNETLLNHIFQENTPVDGERPFDYYPQDSIYFIKK